MMITVYAIIAAVCAATTTLSIITVYLVTRSRRRRRPHRVEPVTVLKPLCGADDALERNLETFFRQDYPAYEILFGVEGRNDPAVPVVERLRDRYPAVPCRLVIHDGRRALNPKVSNLRAMLEQATHDAVVISDSNVAAAPDYLGELVGQLQDRRGDRPVGLVTSLIAGVGERRLGARLDNLHLVGPGAGSVAASQLFGGTFVIGKSMLFRRSLLQRLGGLESVSTLLAEDFVIGRMFQTAGYEVRLAAGVIDNVNVRTTVGGFIRRQLRWGLMRSRLSPLLYAGEVLANPLAVALAAPLFGASFGWALLGALGLILVRDVLQWLRLRGPRGIASTLLGPLKELFVLGIWIAAPFARRVGWRGKRFKVSAGTRLYAEQPVPPPRRSREMVIGTPRAAGPRAPL